MNTNNVQFNSDHCGMKKGKIIEAFDNVSHFIQTDSIFFFFRKNTMKKLAKKSLSVHDGVT